MAAVRPRVRPLAVRFIQIESVSRVPEYTHGWEGKRLLANLCRQLTYPLGRLQARSLVSRGSAVSLHCAVNGAQSVRRRLD